MESIRLSLVPDLPLEGFVVGGAICLFAAGWISNLGTRLTRIVLPFSGQDAIFSSVECCPPVDLVLVERLLAVLLGSGLELGR